MIKVAITRGNAYDATIKALELTNFENLVKRKSRIVIKPNLKPVITTNYAYDTDVIRAILDKIPNPKRVTIADGTYQATTLFEMNNFYNLEKEYGIKIVDTNYDKFIELKVDNPLSLKKILVSKTVHNSDFIISLGKLKIHSLAVVTCSLKNMMGFCPGQQRLKIHAFIPHALVDLISVLTPDYGIINGMVANEIDEIIPHAIRMNTIIASKDCVALDSVAAEIMGIDHWKVPYIKIMAKKELGIADFDEIEVVGEKIEDIKRKFKIRKFNIRSTSQKFFVYFLIKIGLYNRYYNYCYLPFDYLFKKYMNKLYKIYGKTK